LSEEELEAVMEQNADLGQTFHARTNHDATFAVSKGQRLRDTRYATLYENGVVKLDLMGPIYPRANMMTSSGAVSMSQFVHDFVVAYNDPAVLGIVMDVDSPGGDVRGIGEGARVINQLATQGKKPVAAYGSGYMASAAYYIASAVGPGNLYANESAQVGSIGVLMELGKSDNSRVTIVASRSPNKRPDIATDEGQQKYRQRADDLLSLFERDVAKQRAISVEQVYNKYGQGDVFIGTRAKEHGMVDKLTTLADAMRMVERDSIKSRSTRVSMHVSDAALALISFTEEEIVSMGLKDSITGLLNRNSARAATADEQINTEAPDAHESDDTNTDASEGQPKVVQQIVVQSLTDKSRATLEDEFEALATVEVEKLVLQHKVLPADAPQAILELVNARIDDSMFGGQDVLFINAEGQAVTGTREDAAKARLESRQAHSLTQPAIQAVKVDGKTSNLKATILGESEDDTSTEAEHDRPMSDERRAKLLGASAQGQQVLQAKQQQAS
jgi:ClpP class serine protease